MSRHIKLLAILAISVLIILQYSSVSIRLFNNTQVHEPNKSIKTILYWTSMFSQKDHYLGVGQKIFENCSYSNCYATYDKGYLAVDKYDALIFHQWDFKPSRSNIPTTRSPNQIYILSNLESPRNIPPRNNYQNFFNWTMTYRLDSDVVRRYGAFHEQRTDYRIPSIAEIGRKRKKIAWFVSHCKTPNEREKLAERISKVVAVDIYGSCGTLSCSRKNENECYDLLEKEYKFYLSFENSVCEDYVTEKLYNVLKKNVVPIVFGGANYSVFAPPKSVINVLDFKSVENLTDYIMYLDAHSEEYLKYFEWKKNYVVDTSRKNVLCDLCKKLNEPRKPKVYSDMVEWWNGDSISKCFDVLVRNL